MAKSTTPKTPETPAAAAPAQPWEKPAVQTPETPAESEGANASPAPETAPATENAESPAQTPAAGETQQPDPTRSPNTTVVDEEGKTISTNETPSEVRDQLSPSGPSPEAIDAAAEGLTGDASPDRVSAEAKDQLTPSGEDPSAAFIRRQDPAELARLEEAHANLTDAQRQEFEDHMTSAASAFLTNAADRAAAEAIAVKMVDGTQIYGNVASEGLPPVQSENVAIKRIVRRTVAGNTRGGI